MAGTEGFYLTSTIGVNPNKQAVFGPVTIEGTVNGTLVAVNKYKLSVVTNPEGIADVTVYPKSDEYQENDEVTLTAADKFGYNFVNWTDKNGTELSTESKFKIYLNIVNRILILFRIICMDKITDSNIKLPTYLYIMLR